MKSQLLTLLLVLFAAGGFAQANPALDYKVKAKANAKGRPAMLDA